MTDIRATREELLEYIPAAGDPQRCEDLGGGKISIGFLDASLKVSGLSAGLEEALRGKYQPFIREQVGEAACEVRVLSGHASYIEPGDGFLRLEETARGKERILLSNHFAGTWQDDARSGRLFVSEGSNVTTALTSFENFFRWLVANLLVERGGFVFHSAGVVRDERGYLFFGHSGSGKSTVSGFSPGAKLLSDDLVFVFPEGRRYLCSTTPFSGVMPQDLKDRGSYPVAGCFRLRKSDEVRKMLTAKAAAFGLLVPSCPNIISMKRRTELLYPAVRKFLDIVPVYELFFRKDGGFWDVVLEKSAEGEEK